MIDVAGATVVDADEIVVAATRIGKRGTIEEHDRNPRGVERLDDPQVDIVLMASLLERREEDTGHASIDVLAAHLPGPLFLGAAAPIRAAPHQGVLTGERRTHHPLTDRLEDLGLAKVRNEQAEREPGRGLDCLHECPRAGATLDESGDLEVAHRAAHRDARRPERLAEHGLAGKPRAISQPP